MFKSHDVIIETFLYFDIYVVFGYQSSQTLALSYTSSDHMWDTNVAFEQIKKKRERKGKRNGCKMLCSETQCV